MLSTEEIIKIRDCHLASFPHYTLITSYRYICSVHDYEGCMIYKLKDVLFIAFNMHQRAFKLLHVMQSSILDRVPIIKLRILNQV